MSIDVAAEVVACLKSAPAGDAGTDQIHAWLFTTQNSVAVRLRRILEDGAARDLVTEAAGRTWRRVTNPEGKTQRLWQEMRRAAQYVLDNPESFPDSSRDNASNCLEGLAGPVAIPEDLIGPGPAPAIPHREELAEWASSQTSRGDWPIITTPVLGDFCAVNVLNRLVWLGCRINACYGTVMEGSDVPRFPRFCSRLRPMRAELWDRPDADEIRNACILVQLYLAWRDCPGDGWGLLPAVLPSVMVVAQDPPWPVMARWPVAIAKLSPRQRFIVYPRNVCSALLESRLKTCPGEVASAVKGGLKWLATRLATPVRAAAGATSKVKRKKQPSAKGVARKRESARPLTDKAAAVLDLLKALPANRGMKGPDILAELDKKDPPMTFDQSTLTTRIIPELRPHGVKNRRGVGYYIDPSLRGNSAASTHS